MRPKSTSELLAACVSDDLTVVKSLYGSLPNSFHKSDVLKEMAILAASNNSASVFSYCFDQGLVLNPTAVNDPIVYAACDSQSIPIFQVLLSNGWDSNQYLELQGSALVTACHHGNLDLLNFLLENGAEPNTGFAYPPYEALVWALIGEHRSTEIVKVLLAKGAEVRGGGQLIAAAEHGNLEGVKLLLDTKRCDLEEVIECGEYDSQKEETGTALYMAAKNGRKEIVKALLDSGAKTDWRDKKGRSAKTMADEAGFHEVASIVGARDLFNGVPEVEQIHQSSSCKIART